MHTSANNEDNEDPLNNLPTGTDLDIDTPLFQQGGSNKIGRPRKIKSAAKVALGKNNLWAKSVKKARYALGIQGFHPVKKGGLLHRTAKAYHYQLKNK